MKKFPCFDILEALKKKNIRRTTQLFIFSLICHYNERQRIRGKMLNMKIEKDEGYDELTVLYRVVLSDNEIRKKFKFSVDTLINIKQELINNHLMEIKNMGILSKSRIYKKYKNIELTGWAYKYLNYENEYKLRVFQKNRQIIYIPVRIIYDHQLTYSEKLALIWNISIQKKMGRLPRIIEIERNSGISNRTRRKAKKKYSKFFKNKA